MRQSSPLAIVLVFSLTLLSAQVSENPSLVGLLEKDGRFSILLRAAKAAGLAKTLDEVGPLTLFAPTDVAFKAALGEREIGILLQQESRDRLVEILKLHVVSGAVFAQESLESRRLPSLQGEELTFALRNARLTVQDIALASADQSAKNGLLHVIEGVLMPAAKPVTRTGRALIEAAIERGAPLFNSGNKVACAAIYATVADALLTYEGGLSAVTRQTLAEVLEAAPRLDVSAQAWRLRDALDAAWHQLGEAPKSAVRAFGKETVVTADASFQTPDQRRSGLAVVRKLLGDFGNHTKEVRARSLAREAAQALGEDSYVRRRLLTAANAANSEMRRQIEGIRDDLAFIPVKEAPMPEGFPDPTPVGEIEVKVYPQYRMARASMGKRELGSSNVTFFKLFNHIKKNDIAMTAPVQSDYGQEDSSMAFLYGDSELGRRGPDGSVEVLDVPMTMVLSLGVRGPLATDEMAKARRVLEGWVKEHSDRFEITSGWRTMSYNSPMVPSSRRFSEVQVGIVRRGTVEDTSTRGN